MVIHMKNINLRRDDKQVLDTINWTVHKGEHWALYGMNGAGKTALMNMLCAYYFPSNGELEVCGHTFGQTVLGEKLRRKIGIVSAAVQQKFQEDDNSFEIILSGAFASLGLYEQVTDEMREKAKNILHLLGNIEYADRPYSQLSQGERQRALLGRALMAEPELLLLDEPASGLDFLAREQLLTLIDEIAQQPNAPTMIYVTHHVEEILPIFTKTLLLKEGKVFQSGNTEDILTTDVMSDFFDQRVIVTKQRDRYALFKEN